MSALSTEILFEKFQIIEVLKKDEHAAVFLANHIYLNKKIILKVLNTQKIHDSSLVDRFKREAKILAKLDHPNIIKVLDFGLSKEFFYISFEYIEGESLRNVFKTKTLSQEQKEHLMIQLLKGLDYAHVNQIIHRDIKPENIFVDKNLNVKLGDFGLALSAEDNYVTNPYSIVGTPSYMSPEQIRGSKLTAQSDLFSLGVVLTELFTGQNPFLRENISLTLNEINSYDEISLEEKLSSIPGHLKDILSILLKKNINQRYESAGRILEELNVQVDQPTIVVNNVDTEGRKSKLAWMFIAVIALVVIGIVVVQIINKEKQNTDQLPLGKDSTQLKNDSANQNTISSLQKDETINPVDLKNISKPLMDNSKKDSSQIQNTTQQSETPKQNKSTGLGGLFIDCQPWADIYINGQKINTTPLNNPIPLQAGTYTLMLVNQDYPPYPSRIVNIVADSVTRLKVNLNSIVGFININTNPWGEVYIGNEKKGPTPLRLIKVNPGQIHVVIKRPNYRDIDTFYNVRAGDTLKLNFNLKIK